MGALWRGGSNEEIATTVGRSTPDQEGVGRGGKGNVRALSSTLPVLKRRKKGRRREGENKERRGKISGRIPCVEKGGLSVVIVHPPFWLWRWPCQGLELWDFFVFVAAAVVLRSYCHLVVSVPYCPDPDFSLKKFFSSSSMSKNCSFCFLSDVDRAFWISSDLVLPWAETRGGYP